MAYKRFIFPLLLSLLLMVFMSSCRGVFKSAFDNFSAYYNTFYNARHEFHEGLKQVEKQKITINPEAPISVFTPPVKVGTDNFDKAISKGADILRYHGTSKWADNALLLIGKSYFYELKFFAASQKFDELFNTTQSSIMQQRAVFWKSRAFIEMKQFDAGIDYLQRNLNDPGLHWDKQLKVRTLMALASLQVGAKDYTSAMTSIREALPRLKGKKVKARSWFLLGQLQEMAGDYNEAYNSYSHVDDTHPVYELVSLARSRKAIVARKGGQLSRALQIFIMMSNDDKNYDILPRLRYQIARTLQAMKHFDQSEVIYNQDLRNKVKQPDRNTKARIYYGLGEIYRDYHHNLSKAAAYFDSAASSVQDLSQLPKTFNASDLARSFGEYATLRNQIHDLDSLYWLGSLPKEKFDSVIVEIKKRKLEELKERIRNQKNRKNVLVNVRQIKDQGQKQEDYGFLNYENPEMVLEASQAFHAIWGDRPLVDDWRRVSAVRLAVNRSGTDTLKVSESGMNEQEMQRNMRIDLSKIPMTPAARLKTRKQIAEHEYELGNVFYLSLNMPDSAVRYYKHIIHNYSNDGVTPQAMYSLSQLYNDQGDSVKARAWADSVMTLYPSGIYADRLRAARAASDSLATGELQTLAEEQTDTLQQHYYQLLDSAKSMPPVAAAERLRTFGLNYSISDLAPQALYNAAQYYIIAARNDSTYKRLADKWYAAHRQWKAEQQEFQVLKDTAAVRLAKDSTLTDQEKEKWKHIADSTLAQPSFREYYPFQGVYWDSARSVLNQIVTYFPTYRGEDDVRTLQSALAQIPAEPAKKEEDAGQ